MPPVIQREQELQGGDEVSYRRGEGKRMKGQELNLGLSKRRRRPE